MAKKELTPEQKVERKKKIVFIIRAVLWFVFAAILPFSFIAWRYGLFKKNINMQLSGMGIIAVIILAIVIITFGKYIYKGMKQCLLKQCIHGFITIVVPLLSFYLIISGIAQNIEVFQQSIGCVIVCEVCAIPINPFPTWLAERQIEKVENMSDLVWDRFFKRKKENEQK